MNLFKWIYKCFFPLIKEVKNPVTGVHEEPEDYRNIVRSSIQPNVGAPQSYHGSDSYFAVIPLINQQQISECLPASDAEILMFYIYRKTGKIIRLCARFLYKMCKMIDGIADSGTTPSASAKAVTRYGIVTTDLLIDDTSLPYADFLNFKPTDEMYQKAIKQAGYAFDPIQLENLKEAISQNGCAQVCLYVGDWSRSPVQPSSQNAHAVTVYSFDLQSNGDYKFTFRNHWGTPDQYFLWSQYKNSIFQIKTYLDVPADVLTKVQSMHYKFTYTLKSGMTDIAVKQLQVMLNHEPESLLADTGPGSPGNETSYFGGLTLGALKKWQLAHGLVATGIFDQASINEANKRITPMTLIDALIHVESGGNEQAIGDLNLPYHAYGCLQIRQPLVDDCNKKLGTTYKAQDCLGNHDLSVLLFATYMSIYEPNGNDEAKARCWNGGPGWSSNPKSTDGYWASVRKLLGE